MKKHFVGLTTLCLALMMGVSSVSAFTPPGLAKKGGLPPGIQKKFVQEINHTEDIKYIREILDLLKEKGIKNLKDLIDIIEKKDIKDIKEYNTTIKDIELKERRVSIEDGTAMLSLLVADKAKVQLNDKTAKLEDLRKKDEVYIKLDKNNTITEIKATRKKPVEYTTQGKLLLISEDNEKIYIYEDKKLVGYELKSDVVVRIDGVKTRMNKLTQGMELKLTIEGEQVKLIEVTKEVETERIEGKIVAKYDGKDPLIVVQIDNDIKVFYVEEDLDISGIKTGKEAIIYLEDNKVTSIRIR